jgi:hypothetical protein
VATAQDSHQTTTHYSKLNQIESKEPFQALRERELLIIYLVTPFGGGRSRISTVTEMKHRGSRVLAQRTESKTVKLEDKNGVVLVLNVR